MTGQAGRRCGFIALVGRPNVGKSTLLNALLGQKISITSRKPQTTRHRIIGIRTVEEVQAIYVDTPGIHTASKRALNRYMNQAASSTIQDVDVVLQLCDARGWTPEDEAVARQITHAGTEPIVVANKIDRLKNHDELLPLMAAIEATITTRAIVPICALKIASVEKLASIVHAYLPLGEWVYPDEQVTDRSSRFVAAELIREQFIERLGEELPYRLSVELEYFETRAREVHIGAIVWVERDGQKAIVIGKGGHLMKSVGIAARRELETLLQSKVNLKLWAKVKEGWTDDERHLLSLGYD